MTKLRHKYSNGEVFHHFFHNNKQGYTSDSKAIKIGQYALNKIYLDTVDNQWKILIGCHLLCEKQIKEFISENNLQWN